MLTRRPPLLLLLALRGVSPASSHQSRERDRSR
jgi:hypothetical protein